MPSDILFEITVFFVPGRVMFECATSVLAKISRMIVSVCIGLQIGVLWWSADLVFYLFYEKVGFLPAENTEGLK